MFDPYDTNIWSICVMMLLYWQLFISLQVFHLKMYTSICVHTHTHMGFFYRIAISRIQWGTNSCCFGYQSELILSFIVTCTPPFIWEMGGSTLLGSSVWDQNPTSLINYEIISAWWLMITENYELII